MTSSIQRTMGTSSPARVARQLSLMDLTDDVWYRIIALSGHQGVQINLAIALNSLSPRFHEIYVSFLSSITEFTPRSFTAFDKDEAYSKPRLLSLLKYTVSLKKIILKGIVPSTFNAECVNTLANSALKTLQYVDLSYASVQDCILKPFLECPNLHTLICASVEDLTGLVFDCCNVRAPIRKLDISWSGSVTRGGLQRIFGLSSIEHLILTGYSNENVSLRDVIVNDMHNSNLAATLQYISLAYCDVKALDVRRVLHMMPSLKKIALAEDAQNIWGQGIIDMQSIEEFKLSFPNVTFELIS